jgi:hypothetical protein
MQCRLVYDVDDNTNGSEIFEPHHLFFGGNDLGELQAVITNQSFTQRTEAPPVLGL